MKPESDSVDEELRRQLRAIPSPAAATDVQALQRRVLAQWHDRQQPTPQRARGAAILAGVHPGRRWVLPVLALVLATALASGVWLRQQRGDAMLDDLARPDVLSQMAAGEM